MLLLLAVLVIFNIDHLQTMEGIDGAALGQAPFYIPLRNSERNKGANSFASPSIKKTYSMHLTVQPT